MSRAKDPYTFKPLDDGATTDAQGNALPEDWHDAHTHCVALAGARFSGKSLYMAVLVKQLELMASTEFQQPFAAANESTRRRYEEHYETPLFEEMRNMASTPSSQSQDAYQRDPFIFSLGKWYNNRTGTMDPHYLVIRDVAGEDLENLSDSTDLSFFQHANLVVFLFDPLRVPSVSTFLDGLVPPPKELGGDPEVVLRNLQTVMGDARPPLAVAVSKFDTLQRLEESHHNEWAAIMGNPGAAFRRDTGMRFLDTDSRLLSHEIRSLFMFMRSESMLHQVRGMYPKERDLGDFYRFFAVSALGESPTGDHLSRRGIAPYRVLEPILWMLTNLGVYKTNDV